MITDLAPCARCGHIRRTSSDPNRSGLCGDCRYTATNPADHTDRWYEQAACRDDPDLEKWFPTLKGHNLHESPGVREAKATCNECPVQAECLAAAMREEASLPSSSRHGIRGGLLPQERAKRSKPERPAVVVKISVAPVPCAVCRELIHLQSMPKHIRRRHPDHASTGLKAPCPHCAKPIHPEGMRKHITRTHQELAKPPTGDSLNLNTTDLQRKNP